MDLVPNLSCFTAYLYPSGHLPIKVKAIKCAGDLLEELHISTELSLCVYSSAARVGLQMRREGLFPEVIENTA